MFLHIQAVQKDEISGHGRSGMASLKSNKELRFRNPIWNGGSGCRAFDEGAR